MDLNIEITNSIRTIELYAVDNEPLEAIRSETLRLKRLTKKAREIAGNEQSEAIADSIASAIDGLIRLIDLGATARRLEVQANCIHQILEDARKLFGIEIDEGKLSPSVYGENGGK